MNKNYPKNITDLGQLEELLSRPSQEVLETVAKLDGDFLFLGIAGKIGPSLANMVGRACKEAGVQKKIIGVSRFSDKAQKQKLEQLGVETIAGDLMETDFIDSLPQVKNVIFLAGMKFGSEDNLALTWAVNSYLPAMVAEKFKNSRIVAFSTGCVYPLVDIKSGGSLETDMPMPSGEYAQSCLGRERMFEYGSKKYNTPVAILRLNYAVEMRYGVLVDIAYKIKNDLPVDLQMGFANIIWQGDANAMTIQAFNHVQGPAKILNITGPETFSVRQVAEKFAAIMNKKALFAGTESETALLNNATHAHRLFGYPKISLEQVVYWIADWVNREKELLNKPTHFEVRDGKY
jgi:nucleoside-diphosphate-sugar epimerase